MRRRCDWVELMPKWVWRRMLHHVLEVRVAKRGDWGGMNMQRKYLGGSATHKLAYYKACRDETGTNQLTRRSETAEKTALSKPAAWARSIQPCANPCTPAPAPETVRFGAEAFPGTLPRPRPREGPARLKETGTSDSGRSGGWAFTPNVS